MEPTGRYSVYATTTLAKMTVWSFAIVAAIATIGQNHYKTPIDDSYRNFLTYLLASTDEWVSTIGIGQTATVADYPHKPKKVGIIIDPIVASSGEQFLIDVKSTSDRVIVFGRDNTIGCLDYSNCRVATFPNSGSMITIAMSRSFRLPDRGIDETGIAPDVRITLPYPKVLTDNLDEWVLFVAKTLEE